MTEEQAVSRWECGARYPDLLTAKKIGQILEVTIDELVSGEELERNVEKEPILSKPVENILQTVFYCVAVVAYFLMSIFATYSLFPSESLKATPAGQITLTTISTVFGYYLNLGVLLFGLILSIKNKLTARWTGIIMAVPYVAAAFKIIFTYIEMQIKQNGVMPIGEFLLEVLVLLLFAGYILVYFIMEQKWLTPYVVYGISFVSIWVISYSFLRNLAYPTELGLTVSTVHYIGMLGLTVLISYQCFVWNKKRRFALKNR